MCPPPPNSIGRYRLKRTGIAPTVAALVIAVLTAGIVAYPKSASAQADNVCGYNNVCELGVRVNSTHEFLLEEGVAPLVEVFIKGGKVAPPGGLRFRIDASIAISTASSHQHLQGLTVSTPLFLENTSELTLAISLPNDDVCAVNRLNVLLMPDAGGSTRAKYRIARNGGFVSAPVTDDDCPP